jgi:hypothetical protein
MTFRKFLVTGTGLLILFAVLVGLLSRNHPIILKWVTGSARQIGRPIHCIVYTNGHANGEIKVFHYDKYWSSNKKANNYLVSLTEYDSLENLKFFNVNLDERWLGTPVGTSKDAYDFIMGHLFQSETGGHFVPFQDDIKGFGFDPQLSFTDRQIRFKVPPNLVKFDSVRIELR